MPALKIKTCAERLCLLDRCGPSPDGSGCLRWFVFIEAAAAFDGDELRLVARRAPTIAENFRATGPVGVASTDDTNDF